MRTRSVPLFFLAAPALAACTTATTTPATVGYVALAQANVAGTSAHALSGVFLDGVTPDDLERGRLPGCTSVAEVGACMRVECEAGLTFDFTEAGELSASVNDAEILRATLDEPGTLYSASATGSAFTPGETITLSATGGAIPAFSGTVTAPEPLDLVLPTTLSTASGLTIEWSPTLAADLVGLTVSMGGAARSIAISCRAPASEGSITIDPTLIASFDPENVLAIHAISSNVVDLSAGGHPIQIAATQAQSGSIVVE